jgi:poly(beta-D-mannuronate) lyase
MKHLVLITLIGISCSTAADYKDTLRLDLQRPVDARLTKLEALGVEGSGLFTGEKHLVRTVDDLRQTAGKLKPGDQLILASAEWKDAKFTLEGHGTASAPILIRPETAGGVIFSGDSAIRFHGEHLIIHDLEFREVRPSQAATTIFAVGNGEEKPADFCIFNRLRFINCGTTRPEEWPKVQVWLINMRGKENTVANCTFDGLKNLGKMIGADDLPLNGLQRLHILNNRFRNRPKVSNDNGYEIIQIGWSGARAAPSGSLIQGNVFERCDGENEMITLKASDIVVRDNQFLGCQGVLCLRTANRALVTGNVFDAKGRENTGGVRMQGEGHVITENVFRGLVKPYNYYYWPISLMTADMETYGVGDKLSGYGRAKNIMISRNRFEHCEKRVAVGIYPRPEYPLLPQSIHFEDNLLVGMKPGSLWDYLAEDASGQLPRELHESGTRWE